MSVHSVQVTLQAASGKTRDDATNTFHFNKGGPPVGTDYDNVRDMLKDFYTGFASNGERVVSYLTSHIKNKALVKIVDLDDPKPRVPKYESTFDITPSSNQGLPTEVSLCLSFIADPTTGIRQSSRRNRVYIGPLGKNALADVYAVQTCYETIALSAAEHLAPGGGAVNWEWVVYSPTRKDHWSIDEVWCNNEFDTVRRRGLRETGRKTIRV